MRDSLGFMWMEGPDPPSCYLEKWPCCVGMSDLPHELFITPSRAESGVSCTRPEGVDGRMLLPTNGRRTRHTVHAPSSSPSALGSQLSAHSYNTKRHKDEAANTMTFLHHKVGCTSPPQTGAGQRRLWAPAWLARRALGAPP